MKLIRIVKARFVFTKEQFRGTFRLDKMKSTSKYRSNLINYKDDIIYLNKALQTSEKIDKGDIIIIQDLPFEDEMMLEVRNSKELFDFNNPKIGIYKTPNNGFSFEVFKFKEEENIFQIELNYSNKDAFIGFPKRENHKIGTLRMNQTLSYKINGKVEATASSRKERTFIEHQYYIEYLGEFNKLVFSDDYTLEKSYPPSVDKQIDERKILY